MFPIHIVPSQWQHGLVVFTFSNFWKPTKISFKNTNERREIVTCDILQFNEYFKIFTKDLSLAEGL